MNLIDRNNVSHNINTMKFKDCKTLAILMNQVLGFLMIQDILPPQYRLDDNKTYSLEQQYESLCKVLKMCVKDSESINSFDLVMARLAVVNYIGMGDGFKMDKIVTGTAIIDRNGNEHMAYSYLLPEYNEALDLLSKVDTVSTVGNLETEESYEAMMEIVYRALNRAISKEDISNFIDAEFARKAIRVYFDLVVA